MSQPIILHSHKSGPNPWKVAIILEELGLPYETKFHEMGSVKQEPYTKLNPNGRVPAIEDSNNGINLWESGAIIEYLIDQYDTSHKLSFDSKPEKYYTKQWLYFQVSGQGPYFGQAAWFGKFHHEKIPSAIERYQNEAKRVTAVLNNWLEGKEYLVGDKCTYADLSFIPWYSMLPMLLQGQDIDLAKEYPNWHAWIERLKARPAVKKVLEEKAAAAQH